jgi:enoyl-CoA hydratase/carnithine racemase
MTPTRSSCDEDTGVTLELRGHVLVVAMNRPHKRNAVNAEVSAALDAAFNRLEDDPEVWVGILTGSPDVFSAGNDLVSGSGTPTARGGQYGLITRDRCKPLIAAVEGLALCAASICCWPATSSLQQRLHSSAFPKSREA